VHRSDGGRQLVRFIRFAQQSGNAEVEQLHLTILGHENVARLEVAVHHEIGMGVLHGGTHLEQQPEPRAHIECACIGEVGDGCTLHVLHHDVRLAVFGHTAVQQRGDVGVAEVGEDLPFVPEALHGELASQPTLEELERHPFAILIVGAHAFEHRAHPAFTDQPYHLVHTNARADQ
jgi:hypothetical protein